MSRLFLTVACSLMISLQPEVPDLVILNARVFTGVDAQPWAEAVAVRGTRIVAVGATDNLRARAGPSTRIVDAEGRLVIPGLNDAHLHPGYIPDELMLPGPHPPGHDATWDEIVARIQEARLKVPPARWILAVVGSAVVNDPRARRADLDAVSGGHPVLLFSFTGHAVVVNTRALEALGLSLTAPDPPGGVFGREADGRTLNGEAQEYAAFALLRTLVHLVAPQQQQTSLETIAREAAGFGITSLQVLPHGYTPAGVDDLLERRVPIRVRAIDMPLMAAADWRPSERRAPLLPLVTRSGTKFIVDGGPVERTMFIGRPYEDQPATHGRLNITPDELRQFLRRAFAAREQPLLHAVGDAAIDVVLDALDATGGAQWKALRPRIEHGYMFEDRHVQRALRMGVIVVANPSHFNQSAMLRARLGDRRSRSFAHVRSMVEAGVPLALGSDGPLNPFLNIMWATTPPGNTSRALTPVQALKAYTVGSAAAEFTEGEKGTIAPGKLADLAVLSQNIFDIPAEALPKTVSLLTLVDGHVVHEALSRENAREGVGRRVEGENHLTGVRVP